MLGWYFKKNDEGKDYNCRHSRMFSMTKSDCRRVSIFLNCTEPFPFEHDHPAGSRLHQQHPALLFDGRLKSW